MFRIFFCTCCHFLVLPKCDPRRQGASREDARRHCSDVWKSLRFSSIRRLRVVGSGVCPPHQVDRVFASDDSSCLGMKKNVTAPRVARSSTCEGQPSRQTWISSFLWTSLSRVVRGTCEPHHRPPRKSTRCQSSKKKKNVGKGTFGGYSADTYSPQTWKQIRVRCCWCFQGVKTFCVDLMSPILAAGCTHMVQRSRTEKHGLRCCLHMDGSVTE